MTSSGLTFDTGALIALERRSARAWNIAREAVSCGVVITVPSPVVAEWWRGRTEIRELIRRSLVVEPLSEATAQRAGDAIAAVRGTTVVDAIVMASAAARGDVVYTSDFADLDRLTEFFRTVRVLSI